MTTPQEAAEWLYHGAKGAPYFPWPGGEVSPGDGPPAWADNAPAPPIELVREQGGFCVAVASLIQRKCGVPVPNPYNDPAWDGGTRATYDAYYDDSYFYSSRRGQGFENFDLLVTPWREGGGEGHVGVVWFYNGTPYVLEWIHSGLTWDFTVDYSNTWGAYEIVVPADVWLPLVDGPSPRPEPGREAGEGLTEALLIKCMTSTAWAGPDLTPADAARFLPSIKKYCAKYGITTRARFAAWLGEMGYESGSFSVWGEVGQGGGAFGDYYGRGPGQMTWEETYRQFAHETGWDAYNSPDIVSDREEPDCGFESSTWLWDEKGLNHWADQATWEGYSEITYRWLGVYEHPSVPDRNARYAHAWDTLPANFDLGESAKPEPEKEEDLSFAIYTFAASGPVATDIANAATMVLEHHGIDALPVNGDDNIWECSRRAFRLGQIDQANCIVVGEAALTRVHEDAREAGAVGWDGDDTVWFAPGVNELTFVRNWCLPWIMLNNNAAVNEVNLVVNGFENQLLALDATMYRPMIEASRRDPDEPPPPPPPPPQKSVEEMLADHEERLKRLERTV